MIYKGREYKEIPNFSGYFINKGTAQVISTKPGRNVVKGTIKELAPVVNSKGYLQYYMISSEGKKLSPMQHQLIMRTFVGNKNNLPHINHIDADKTNNTITNLEWCSAKHNTQHAVDNGLLTHNHCKKEVHQYDLKGNYLRCYESLHEAARDNGTDASNIYYVVINKTSHCKGKLYSYLKQPKIAPYKGKPIIKEILVKDLDTGKTETFKTLKSAAEFTGIHRATLMRRFKSKGLKFYIENYFIEKIQEITDEST